MFFCRLGNEASSKSENHKMESPQWQITDDRRMDGKTLNPGHHIWRNIDFISDCFHIKVNFYLLCYSEPVKDGFFFHHHHHNSLMVNGHKSVFAVFWLKVVTSGPGLRPKKNIIISCSITRSCCFFFFFFCPSHFSVQRKIFSYANQWVWTFALNFIIMFTLHEVTVETVIKALVYTLEFHIIGCKEPFTSIREIQAWGSAEHQAGLHS